MLCSTKLQFWLDWIWFYPLLGSSQQLILLRLAGLDYEYQKSGRTSCRNPTIQTFCTQLFLLVTRWQGFNLFQSKIFKVVFVTSIEVWLLIFTLCLPTLEILYLVFSLPSLVVSSLRYPFAHMTKAVFSIVRPFYYKYVAFDAKKRFAL